MALPITYNIRNVVLRWRATLATVLGVALVVAVYVLVQSLAVGLEKSSGNTGDPRNVMIVRKGATAESSSQVTRAQLRLIQYWPEIARDEAGRPLLSADISCSSTSRATPATAKPTCWCAGFRRWAFRCGRR